MKLTRASWLLASVIATFSPMLQAADAQITIKGRVVATPCTVETTKTSVDLVNISLSELASSGAVTSWHPVLLKLASCPSGTSKVTARFSGTADPNNSKYYKNLGTATNVQLELQDENNTSLGPNTTKEVAVDDSSKSTAFQLKVRVITTQGGATQGTIQAVINVTYTYS